MVHFRSHTCKLGSMILMVLIYFIVELIVGYALHSITLVADSFHMLSDFIALIIGIAARRIGKWPKSNKNTFGWQRAEVVGTLLNTVMLTTLTFTILIQTIQRFIQPERIERPKLLLGVGTGGLLINIIGMIILGGHHGHSHGGDTTTEVLIKDDEDDLTKIDKNDPENINVTVADGGDINEVGFIHSSVNAHNGGHGHSHEGGHGHSHEGGHGHSHKGGHAHSHEGGHDHSHDEVSNGTDHKKNNGHSHGSGSMNLRAVFLHVLADFFGSVAVVISALIIWLVPDFTNNPEGDAWKNYIDPSISLLMVFLILLSTIPLLKKSALILLQSVPKEVSVTKLKERMETIDGIDKVHDLHVWQLQSDVIIGTVHIRCANENYVTVSKKAKKLFHDFNIHCTTIQAEFNEHLEDSNSNHSMEGGTNDDECVLFCDDKSTVTGSNECKGKQSCCPTRNTSNVALNARIVDTPMVVRVHPVLQHQQSAPCLTSMVPVTQSSNIQLENIKEKQ